MAPSTDDIKSLKSKIWGIVALPGEAEFLAGTHTAYLPVDDRTPALVVRARGTMDVQEAVKFAVAHGLELCVKSGGHSAALHGLAKGALCIDLSFMRGCTVDPAARVATAEGGCLLGDIDRETAVHGLMVPLGHAPVTGMGLALGGGVGIGTRLFGSTADHIVGATLVTADGAVVVVDEGSDPELLWALRGGGGSLGVVTSVKLRLHPLKPDNTYTGFMMWHEDEQNTKFKAIAKWMLHVGRHEPGYSSNLMRMFEPNGSPAVAAMVLYVGSKSREDKAQFMQPLRDLQPSVDTVGQARYVDTQFSLLEPIMAAPPMAAYWTTGQLPEASATDAMVDDFVKHVIEPVDAKTYPTTLWLFDMWGSELRTQSKGPNPFKTSTCEIGWLQALGFLDPSQFESARTLSRKTKSAMAQYGEEAYQNLTTDEADELSLAVRVGGAENLARLRTVKARVDPHNLFNNHALRGLGA